jgi:hypothetical protein
MFKIRIYDNGLKKPKRLAHILTIFSNFHPGPAFNASVLRWEWEPKLEPLSNGDVGQYLNLSSGVDIWYTTMGPKKSRHTPVLILHGGIGNSNQMYQQANMLAQTRRVILQEYASPSRRSAKHGDLTSLTALEAKVVVHMPTLTDSTTTISLATLSPYSTISTSRALQSSAGVMAPLLDST